MPDNNFPTPSRPWREIAAQLAIEMNPAKMLDLTLELNQALAEQEPCLKPKTKSV